MGRITVLHTLLIFVASHPVESLCYPVVIVFGFGAFLVVRSAR